MQLFHSPASASSRPETSRRDPSLGSAGADGSHATQEEGWEDGAGERHALVSAVGLAKGASIRKWLRKPARKRMASSAPAGAATAAAKAVASHDADTLLMWPLRLLGARNTAALSPEVDTAGLLLKDLADVEPQVRCTADRHYHTHSRHSRPQRLPAPSARVPSRRGGPAAASRAASPPHSLADRGRAAFVPSRRRRTPAPHSPRQPTRDGSKVRPSKAGCYYALGLTWGRCPLCAVRGGWRVGRVRGAHVHRHV
jgi:hypothetical protein